MCHIIQCVTLGLDLIQRLITYFFVCFIFIVVYIALTAALIAGMTYGYKYYLAEYYTLNSTLNAIRKISMDPTKSELAEFDMKHYKSLIDYYEFKATSTDPPETTEAKPDNLVMRKNLNTNEPQQLLENKLSENEIDRATLDFLEDIERATVVSDYSDSQDVNEYMKKIKWVERSENDMTKAHATNLGFFEKSKSDDTVNIKVTTRQWEPVATRDTRPMVTTRWVPTAIRKVIRTESTTKRLSGDTADRPNLRYLLPVNKIASASTSNKGSGIFYLDKIKTAVAIDNVKKRTVEPNISNTTIPTSSSDGKVLRILLKHLTTIPSDVTTSVIIPKKTSTTESPSDNLSTTQIKEYERKLNLALAQRDDKTKKEIIVIV